MTDLQRQFGQLDIYLFDQLLRARIVAGMRLLDAGCGAGRNLVYLLKEGYEVFALDQDPNAVEEVRRMAAHLAPNLSGDHFAVAPIERMPHQDAFFDVVISSAVLHFAQTDKQFQTMLRELWRVLKPGGFLFCRMASSIGLKKELKRIKGRRFLLPDGSERYLVDEEMLLKLTGELNGTLLDPIKTTIVQSQRSMTTWVVSKNPPAQLYCG